METGITKTGFSRKSYQQIEDDVQLILEGAFGAAINTDPETPTGQFKTSLSLAVNDLWHLFEAKWQSRDLKQLEGTDLDNMAEVVRNIKRIPGETDAAFLLRILNPSANGNLHEDVISEIRLIPGVTRASILYNEESVVSSIGLPPHSWSVFVIGGDETEVATVLAKWAIGGTGIYGNVSVNVLDKGGRCRVVKFVRPVAVPIRAAIDVENVPSGCSNCSTLSLTDLFSHMRGNSCQGGISDLQFDFGRDVYPSDIAGLISPSTGTSVRAIDIGLQGDPAVLNPIPIQWFEYATLKQGDLVIT